MPFFGGGGAGDYHIIGTNIEGGVNATPAVIGDNNMALGNGAGQLLVDGDRNILIGSNAGNQLGDNGLYPANRNVIIGAFAAEYIPDINNSTIINALDDGPMASESSLTRTIVIGSSSALLGSDSVVNFSSSVCVNNVEFLGAVIQMDNVTLLGKLHDGADVFGGSHIDSTFVGNNIALSSDNVHVFGNNTVENATRAIVIGSGQNVTNQNNCIAIGFDSLTAVEDDSIIIGDCSHTYVSIGCIDLTALAEGQLRTATWATLPLASTAGNGARYRITDTVTGSIWRSNGIMWVPEDGGSLCSSEVGWLMVQGFGQTGINATNMRGPASISTATSGPSISNVDYLTKTRRVEYNTGAVAGTSCEIHQIDRCFLREHGFYFSAVFGQDDVLPVVGVRSFCGVMESVSPNANANPSSFITMMGMGNDSADANMQFMHNDALGVATKVDLGAAFPVTHRGLYMLEMSAIRGSTDIYWLITNMESGATASGIAIANVPVLDSLFSFSCWRNNGSSALNAKMVFSKMFTARYE